MRVPLSAIAIIVMAVQAVAATWTVERDGSGDFHVIQDAVDAAASGDTLLIGPGRYTEFQTYTGWNSTNPDCYVVIADKSLTVIGSGGDVTIIGPEVAYWENNQTPFGIFVHSDTASVEVRGLTVENVARGICVNRNHIRVHDIIARGCYEGLYLWVLGGGEVSECEFYDNIEGILMGVCERRMNISNLEMQDNLTGLSIQYSDSVYVYNANIRDCGTGIMYAEGATGEVRSCDISGVAYFGLIAVGGSSLVVAECSVIGAGYYQVDCASCQSLYVEDSMFYGAERATVRAVNGVLAMRGNHIINGGGYSVHAMAYPNPPAVVLDLENNYWGTSSRDSIEAWIYDIHDDPSIHAEVDFDPFSPVPLPDEKKSLGDVKRMFR